MPNSVDKFHGDLEQHNTPSPDSNVVKKIKEIFSGAELRLISYINEGRTHALKGNSLNDISEYESNKTVITKYLNEFLDKGEKCIFGKDTFIEFLDYMAENESTLDLECLVFPYLELFNGLDDEIIEKMIGIGKDKGGDGEGHMCMLCLYYIDCFPGINIGYLFKTFESTSDKHPKLRVNNWRYKEWRKEIINKICEAGYQVELERRVGSRGPEHLETLKKDLQ